MVGEKIYTVRMIKSVSDSDDLLGYPTRKIIERVVKVSANKIVEDKDFITFYDQWGDCSGRFKKSAVISFAREVEDNNG